MRLVDAHCDTISTIMEKKEKLYQNTGHLSIELLKRFDAPLEFFAIWLDDCFVESAFENTIKALDFFEEQVALNSEHIGIVKSFGSILENERRKKISALVSLEGGEALMGSMDNLYAYYQRGVRGLTLLWNRQNAVGGSVAAENAGGLTPFGKEVVREMNRLGMVVDVSHLSVKGFWDVYDTADKPFIASHSNCFALCGHPRNLSDDQLRALKERRGVAGINLYPEFLDDSGKADMRHVLKHIDHMLNVAGEDCVGLGSDYDGIPCTPDDMQDITSFLKLYDVLAKQFGGVVAEKVCSGNMLRMLSEVLEP